MIIIKKILGTKFEEDEFNKCLSFQLTNKKNVIKFDKPVYKHVNNKNIDELLSPLREAYSAEINLRGTNSATKK